MKKIMFNDKYGLTQAVLEGRKTQTRRTFLKPGEEKLLDGITPEYIISVKSRYKVGETVAIAQSYKDIHAEVLREVGPLDLKKEFRQSKGYTNKMFVRAERLPHAIRITNIRVERLQDISKDDCLKEGIKRKNERYVIENEGGVCFYTNDPILAFRFLIDKTCGKGTWERNPYVFVYDFELIN